jgi:peptidoglycan hydrolase-like protein with peptidoglycan-binding domain
MSLVSTKHVVAAFTVAVMLSACSSSDGAVKAAELKVSKNEKAVTEAQAAFDSKSKAFCQDSKDYILALDRYGNLLTQSATTVGDVKDGGKDLSQPRATATDSATAAADAHEALLSAQEDLATAQDDLVGAKAKAAGQTTTPARTTTTIAPPALVPTATVDRVQQAESDLATAEKGITDQTPLTQASVQFNAAAVASEISWLRLFSDAGCLTDEQQSKADAAVHDFTVELQQGLAAAGYYDGKVDGVYGPATVEAVRALQQAKDLPVTGYVDRATSAALQTELQQKGGVAAKQTTASTAALQQTLKLAGHWDGPVDGQWSPALTNALESFQTELGVPATGVVDPATVAAFEKARSSAVQSPSTTTPSSTASASTTSAPS